MGPGENHCPSLSSTTSATPLGGLWVRPCVVPCLAGGPSPDILAPIEIARAPVGGSDFACMFWRFLMVTWALSLVPIMAMFVRILFTSHDRLPVVLSAALERQFRPRLLCDIPDPRCAPRGAVCAAPMGRAASLGAAGGARGTPGSWRCTPALGRRWAPMRPRRVP